MHHREPNDLSKVQEMVNLAVNLNSLQTEEQAFLLSVSQNDVEAAEIIFEGARKLRDRFFGSKIFLYGFVYLSTYCRNDCSFCNYRISNRELKRYRKELGLVFDVAMELAEGGVHLIDLTLGEDETFLNGSGFDSLLKVVESIAKYSNLPIMLSPGVLDKTRLSEAASAGVTWYALYQETFNRSLFSLLRRNQDYDLRLEAKALALESGLLIEDGVLIGVGASESDLADSIKAMKLSGARQVRAMAYVPAEGGISADLNLDRSWQELLMIACLRLANPDALIPASLDVDGLAGLKSRLSAGANVVTSIVPPDKGFAGVASMSLDIDNCNRTPNTVIDRLGENGLTSASAEDYRLFVKNSIKESSVSK